MKNLDTTPRISVDAAPRFCQTESLSIWSLWTLLETYAWNLVNVIDALTWTREGLTHRLTSAQQGIRNLDAIDITEADKQNIVLIYEQLKPWLDAHGLTASLDQYKRILDETVEDEPDIHTIISRLKNFNTTIEDELRRKVFLYLSPENLTLYKAPETLFPLTLKAYPQARYDIIQASRCIAFESYTASVYHSMGIAQVGLHALADELGVSFSYSIDLADWNGVISAIENKIKQIRELPKGDEKDRKLSFYSGCASQFRYFKDAWRNHVAHMREEYDNYQANSVLIHVRDFMERMSQRT